MGFNKGIVRLQVRNTDLQRDLSLNLLVIIILMSLANMVFQEGKYWKNRLMDLNLRKNMYIVGERQESHKTSLSNSKSQYAAHHKERIPQDQTRSRWTVTKDENWHISHLIKKAR